KKVLIADDAPEIVEMLHLVLERRGYQVVGFDNGKKAVEAIPEEKPDIILLDIIMPGMTGLDVCEKVKNDPATKDIPVILITSATEGTDLDDGFWNIGTQSDDFLSKPFNPAELAARVDQLVLGTPLPPEFVKRTRSGAQRVDPSE
ncbi:MAG: response regulator, partial [Candidatus Omnitrophica bacterium]|nr:response regulator [Candidatus Omnitrophota bacterium]